MKVIYRYPPEPTDAELDQVGTDPAEYLRDPPKSDPQPSA